MDDRLSVLEAELAALRREHAEVVEMATEALDMFGELSKDNERLNRVLSKIERSKDDGK